MNQMDMRQRVRRGDALGVVGQHFRRIKGSIYDVYQIWWDGDPYPMTLSRNLLDFQCLNCKMWESEHGPNKKCLFGSTHFREKE